MAKPLKQLPSFWMVSWLKHGVPEALDYWVVLEEYERRNKFWQTLMVGTKAEAESLYALLKKDPDVERIKIAEAKPAPVDKRRKRVRMKRGPAGFNPALP